MKIRHIGLILCLVALLVVGLTACGVGPAPDGGTLPPAGGTFTVTFTGVSGIDPQQVAANGCATEPANDPEKAGYTFEGWYLGNAPYDFSTPVTSDITLKAKFTPRALSISYELVYSDARNSSQNPASYTVEDDITFKAASHPDYTFMGWVNKATGEAVKSIAAGEMTENLTLVATWGYDPVVNVDFEGMTIHYAELNNGVNADGTSTGFVYEPAIPGTENQYYVNASGIVASTTAAYIQMEYADRLDFAQTAATSYKSRRSPVYIENAGDAHKNYLTFKQDSTKLVEFTTPIDGSLGMEDYDISVIIGLKTLTTGNAFISFDLYMSAEGVIPFMFYVRHGTHGFRHALITVDTNGDLYVGWDAISADRVGYTNPNGTKVAKTKVGTATIGEWHTISFELTARRQKDGYDVVIKLDGAQLGDNAFTLKTEGNFNMDDTDYCFTDIMVFGGGKTHNPDESLTDLGNQINDTIAAKGGTYKAEYRFDNFVVSDLLLPPEE